MPAPNDRIGPSPEPEPRAPKAKRRAGPLRWIGRMAGLVAALLFLVALGGAAVAWRQYTIYTADLPSVEGLRNYQPRVMSRVYAGNAQLIAELATERRIFVPMTAIPKLVSGAFISAEDQKFWSHRGVDPAAIARAAWTDLMMYGSGRRPIGASTITQQVAKNMILGNEVSLGRKAKELILALRIEATLPKERILELYLNEIYLGLQAHGVAAAAQAYFNKGLDDLTLPEAAFLAALPKAPNNYNPARFYEAAKTRRDWVIDRMADDGLATPGQAAAAKASPIALSPFRRPETVPGSEWFAEEVRRQLVATYGADATTQSGWVIRTSIDPGLQDAADRSLRAGLMAYDRAHAGYRGPVVRLGGDAAIRAGWSNRLSTMARPQGMLPEWQLAVALEVNSDEAKLGWLDRQPGQLPNVPGASRTASMFLSDTGWARPLRGAGYGPAPRRMGDVIQVGDVVMAELVPAATAAGRSPARPERLVLRQIPIVQGALVSLEPSTGRVLAMSGGWSFEASQFNRATQAERQPGSSFKPMVYLTALESGFSPSQRVLDAPFVQDMGAAGQWRPSNFEPTFNGPTPLRIALERSLNLVTVRLAQKVGMAAVADTARAFHVVDDMPKVLPAALGAVETTVLRQAGAYAGLAMGGKEVVPTVVDSIQDRDGHVFYRPTGIDCTCSDPSRPPVVTDNRKPIADPQSTFQLVTMMQGVVQRGTGYEAGKGLNRPIAGKTGTTSDSNDVWFVGFTPDLVTAVWIGFDNNTSLGEKETGGTVSAPIFHDFMAYALRNRPVLQFRIPDGVKLASWDSGYGSRIDAFKPDQPPGGSQGTIGGGDVPAASDGLTASSGPGLGVDSGQGGLY